MNEKIELKQKCKNLLDRYKEVYGNLTPCDRYFHGKARFYKDDIPDLILEILEESPFVDLGVESLTQNIYLIMNDYTDVAKCKHCGSKEITFRSHNRGYDKFCSYDCAYQDKDRIEKVREANIGRESWCRGLTKETDERLTKSIKKQSETKKRKYASGELVVWSKGLTKETDERLAIAGKNMSKRWAERGITDKQLEHTLSLAEVNRQREFDPKQFEKSKATCIKKYGVPSVLCFPEVRALGQEAMLEKYGRTNYQGSELYYANGIKDQMLETMKATNLEKYGVEHVTQHPDILAKVFETKKKNGTIGNKSKLEDAIFNSLVKTYPSMVRQHKTEDYPWFSDFYIPEYNLYIELQGYYAHGFDAYFGIPEQDQWFSERTNKAKGMLEKVWKGNDIDKRTHCKTYNVPFVEFFDFSCRPHLVNQIEYVAKGLPSAPDDLNDVYMNDPVERRRIIQTAMADYNKKESELAEKEIIDAYNRLYPP